MKSPFKPGVLVRERSTDVTFQIVNIGRCNPMVSHVKCIDGWDTEVDCPGLINGICWGKTHSFGLEIVEEKEERPANLRAIELE